MKLAELLKARDQGLVKIRSDQPVADAAAMLSCAKVGALLVEGADGAIVGILSERDIVAGMVTHGVALHQVAVAELMTADVIHCSPNDTVNKAMELMTERRFRHLPVFDGDELLGLISIGDLVKWRIMEVQAEAEAMRQYIAT
ncbi:MAG: CBS domain-containing protein [Pseudomonadota bacterium]